MEQKNNEEIEINLLELARVALDKLPIIILSTILFALIGFAYAKFYLAPVYNSTTKIYILSQQDSDTVTLSDLQTGTSLSKDFEAMITSRTVLEQVINELDLGTSYEALAGSVSVTAETDTRIIAISVTRSNPYEAKVIADKVREVSAVQIADIMDLEAVKVVDEANLPSVASGPNVRKYMTTAALLGLFVSFALIIIVYLMNDKIRTSEDIEKYLGISTLGTIPIDESLSILDKGSSKRKKSKGKRK